MGTKKISELDLLAVLTSGAEFEIALDGKSYRITADVLFEFVKTLIETSGLDLTGAAALGFNIFAMQNAPEDWDHGWGGDPIDIRYLNGLWLTLGLDKNETYNTITHKEATKDETALAIHIPSDFFAGETFRGIALISVQGTAARIAAGNIIGGGLPDRLIYPAYGAIGGYEMIKVFADNKSMAAAGDRDEMDGNGAGHGYDVRVHQERFDDGVTEVWYTGRELNDSNGRPNFPDHPSARWGIRSTIDLTETPPETTLIEVVYQSADPTGDPAAAPDYQDVTVWPLWPAGTGPRLAGPYDVTSMPSADPAGQMVLVTTDDVPPETKTAFSNGSSWELITSVAI